MIISHKQLREINEVQIRILKAVADACSNLGIVFYMVHGSLLGAVRNHEFIPDDDDIDIAMFRSDYERFIKEAPKFLNSRYFIQTINTDPNYPLSFGKIRDSLTTYIIEEAKHLNMNHGIYIDVFPIDFIEEKGINRTISKIKLKLLDMRIASVYNLKHENFIKKVVRFSSKIIFPSFSKALKRREKLLSKCTNGDNIRITGGKVKEQAIPYSWFEKAKVEEFEKVKVFVPCDYNSYLTQIYGDYEKRTLVEDKISDERGIEVNACDIDVTTPYEEYIRRSE